MIDRLVEQFGKIPKRIVILLAIVLVGFFFRAYNFHDWLSFESDQVRDATLVGEVVDGRASWPQIGPTMRKSGISEDKLFHLGPIYYYFQIISAKTFGNAPDKMDYPDLLFSVLSIPLFYYFLKRYFEINLSLSLTGIYAISFFSIQYARFAWNSNPIPFFVILFLSSLHEFLIEKEKVSWIWAVLLGISIGVGVQLHAIILILFSLTTFFVFVFSMKNSWRSWSKWLVVLLVVLILNAGQINNDRKNNFSNAKVFLNFPASNNPNKLVEFLSNLKDDVGCHMEANTYIIVSTSGTNSLSSGSDSCSYLYNRVFESQKIAKSTEKSGLWLWVLPGILFSVLGYAMLIYFFFKEKEMKKKYFLGLGILYIVSSFLVMEPVTGGGFKEFRYFIHVFFVPYLLLGLLLNFLKKKYHKIYPIVFVLILTLLIISNLIPILSKASIFNAKMANDSNSAFLGETESMVEYLNINGQNEIYLNGDKGYLGNFFKPLAYLSKRRNFNIIDAEGQSVVPQGKPLFYLTKSTKNDNAKIEIGGRKIDELRNFGQVVIYKLAN